MIEIKENIRFINRGTRLINGETYAGVASRYVNCFTLICVLGESVDMKRDEVKRFYLTGSNEEEKNGNENCNQPG